MGHPVDERTMIQRLVTRQATAWSEFAARYRPLVFARVKHTAVQCRFQLDYAELEDICAEVFTSLIVNDFRSLRQFKGQCRLSTWLSVIARRVCLRQLSRLRQNRGPWQIPDSNGMAIKQDLLTDLVKSEQSDALGSTVQRLNEGDRLLIELYFLEELSYAEIGRRAGISINSVGPKLNRAVSRLRSLMGQA